MKIWNDIPVKDFQRYITFENSFFLFNKNIKVRSNCYELIKKIRKMYCSFHIENREMQKNVYSLVSVPIDSSLTREKILIFRDERFIHETPHIYLKCLRDLSDHWTLTLSDCYLVHASAITKDQRAIILPGSSKCGKTSLALSLLENNFQYLSDDIAVFDPITCEVISFPTILHVRETTIKQLDGLKSKLKLTDENYVIEDNNEKVCYKSVEDIFPNSLGKRSKVKYIIFPIFDPLLKKYKLTQISRSEALIKLLYNSLYSFSRYREKTIDILAKVVNDTSCYSLYYNNLYEANRSILDLVE